MDGTWTHIVAAAPTLTNPLLSFFFFSLGSFGPEIEGGMGSDFTMELLQDMLDTCYRRGPTFLQGVQPRFGEYYNCHPTTSPDDRLDESPLGFWK